MKKNALIIGGSNGIGLSVAGKLSERGYRKIHILDKCDPPQELGAPFVFHRFSLLNDDYAIFDTFTDEIDTLVITAGFGRIDTFNNILDIEIINSYKVNAMAVCRIISRFYSQLLSRNPFYCAVMGSIAGLISSPMFALYGATKAAVCKFLESINVELEKQGAENRILNVSPGNIHGTTFHGGKNDLVQTEDLANAIIDKMFQRYSLFIPQYEPVYRKVLSDYAADPHTFGIQSFDYKAHSGRLNTTPQVKVGYLSGTFDLFHIGHLNLLRRAKACCDYLVVGVHRDAAHKGKQAFIPFQERFEIVGSIRYVDKVVESCSEDTDAYEKIGYHCLFVGSDYKNTDRFLRYEAYFKDKDVQIIYFPYTQGTNSTQLRDIIANCANN
ncbi:MAG: SDR family NAD(P)-dependent oxidoreductase [Prevotellaceae bacterium]|jgi:glycerol-3-phosphate cytidylyltransferase|nr:SDR family NAD(P)-dependent oxidoreductase [Prevotellaceae bacterium]